MSWKCPQCGEIENTDDQVHCTCGYEISDAQLVRAQDEASDILIQLRGQTDDEKEWDGFTYVLKISECIALISTAWCSYYVSVELRNVLSLLSFFVFMLLVMIDSVHRKQISMKYHIVRKQEIPSLYKFLLVFYCLITASIFVKLILETTKLW